MIPSCLKGEEAQEWRRPAQGDILEQTEVRLAGGLMLSVGRSGLHPQHHKQEEASLGSRHTSNLAPQYLLSSHLPGVSLLRGQTAASTGVSPGFPL